MFLYFCHHLCAFLLFYWWYWPHLITSKQPCWLSLWKIWKSVETWLNKQIATVIDMQGCCKIYNVHSQKISTQLLLQSKNIHFMKCSLCIKSSLQSCLLPHISFSIEVTNLCCAVLCLFHLWSICFFFFVFFFSGKVWFVQWFDLLLLHLFSTSALIFPENNMVLPQVFEMLHTSCVPHSFKKDIFFKKGLIFHFLWV